MNLRHSLCLLLACSALAGCNTTATYLEPAEQAVLVRPEDNVLLLKGTSGGSLDRRERQNLVDLVATASRGRRDALHITITGANHALQSAVAREAIALGVPPYNVRYVDEPADPHGRFRVRVSAVRYTVLVPLCPSSAVIGPSVNDNSFDPSLGCSTRHNLAMAVSDPADLLGNSAVVASRADRAAIPVARYATFSGAARGGSGGGAGDAPQETAGASTAPATATAAQ